MAYPLPNPPDVLTENQSIDAIAEAEAGIISCMSSLLYTPTSDDDLTPVQGTLLYNLGILLVNPAYQFDDVAEILKQILCGYACKESSIADIINSLACKLAIEKGVLPDDNEPCDCCFIK